MKLLFFFVVCVLVLEGCGKKSDPLYQSKAKYEIKLTS